MGNKEMDGAKKKLTKREQKAAAFKSGKKGKKAEAIVPLDVPEQDDGAVDDEGHKKLAIPPKTRPNKRKRDDAETTAVEGVPAKSEAVDGEQEGVDEPPKKKKRQRGGAKGKKKSLVDENGVRRRPLFVGQSATLFTATEDYKLMPKVDTGNLPYNITAQMIQQHFAHSGSLYFLTSMAMKNSRKSHNRRDADRALAHAQRVVNLERHPPVASAIVSENNERVRLCRVHRRERDPSRAQTARELVGRP